MKSYQGFFKASWLLVIVILTFSQVQLNPASAEQASTTTWIPIVQKNVFSAIINFDDHDVPCGFRYTTALRDEYSSMGVLFSGTQLMDGGGILNECGNFAVFGYSQPNFLAFNKEAHYLDGGIPTPPQIITFTNTVSSVGFKTGSSFGGNLLTVDAYDAMDNLLTGTSISLTSMVQTVVISTPGIHYVVIDSTALYFVIDDLYWLNE